MFAGAANDGAKRVRAGSSIQTGIARYASTCRSRAAFEARDREVTDAYLAARFGEDGLPPQDYHRLRQVSRSIPSKAKRRPTA
ncbi:MAG: hypothetical protein JRF42_14960 [Deltaproteobacteria bacterium]|nr:hypothetical protein [Deltaproteobacteria bacterium]